MPRSLAAISTHVTLLKVKMVSITLAQQNPRLSQMEYFIIRNEIEDIKAQLNFIRTEVTFVYIHLLSEFLFFNMEVHWFFLIGLIAVSEVGKSHPKARGNMEVTSCKFRIRRFASTLPK